MEEDSLTLHPAIDCEIGEQGLDLWSGDACKTVDVMPFWKRGVLGGLLWRSQCLGSVYSLSYDFASRIITKLSNEIFANPFVFAS